MAPKVVDAEFNVGIERLPPARYVATPQTITPGMPVKARFSSESPVLSPRASQPYALYTVSGTTGQRFVASLQMDDKKAPGSSPLFPMLDVGVDTVAGFAAVSSSMPNSGSGRPAIFEFLRDGEMQIRIVGATGSTSGYTLKVERVESEVAIDPK